VGIVAAATGGLVVFVVRSEDDRLALSLHWDTLSAVFWVLVGAAVAFPSMALALVDPGEDPAS
jgi:hypothetical protein